MSRSAGARGLKHNTDSDAVAKLMSRSAGARGLKPYQVGLPVANLLSRAPQGRVDYNVLS